MARHSQTHTHTHTHTRTHMNTHIHACTHAQSRVVCVNIFYCPCFKHNNYNVRHFLRKRCSEREKEKLVHGHAVLFINSSSTTTTTRKATPAAAMVLRDERTL